MVVGIPLYATWYATGNNIVLFADTARRVLHVRLESPEESPEERTGFHHPDLLAWVQQERPRLVVAAVTILSAYCAAGWPDMHLKPWGSFEGWSGLVRQALVWCGQPDPGETRQELAKASDTEVNALRQLLDGWAKIDADGYGMVVSDVLGAIEDYCKSEARTMPEGYEQVHNAIIELVPPRGGKLPSARSVGMKMNHFRRRVIGGRYFDRRVGRLGNLWYVKSVESCGTSDTCGTISATPRAYAQAHAHAHTRSDLEGPAGPTGPTPTSAENQAVEEFLRS